jgi:integrase
MDENGFRKFLEDRYQGSTPRTYFERAKGFEEWLYEHQKKKDIEDANESDVRNWASYVQNEIPKCQPYFYGVRAYYRYKRKDKMGNLITEILRKLPSPSKIQRKSTIRWTEFEAIMLKVEETISPEYCALFNLLWSEMKSEEILNLYISDIDFENRLIASPTSEKTFRVTWKTWEALEKYKPINERGKSEPLFSIGLRALQHNTRKYLGVYGLTPSKLRRSCKEDLPDAGRTIRFAPEPKKEPSSIIRHEQTEEPITLRNPFDRLVEEIRNFGNRVHYRIGQIKDEGVFKRLLEGYLLAAFPDEIITPEFHFRGYGRRDSKIDFAIGRDQKIPIEAKLTEEKIRDDIGKGLGQVKEFLEHVGLASNRGILVVMDKKRDPERLKLSRIEGNVHIVII